LEKAPWAAEKNVYCAIAGWNSLYTSVSYIVSFSSRISLLIFLSG
jgi:hypothetical protein